MSPAAGEVNGRPGFYQSTNLLHGKSISFDEWSLRQLTIL